MNEYTGLEVAIIGIALKFPGASTTQEFWNNLKTGTESIKFYSDDELLALGIDNSQLNNPNFIKCAGGIIEHKEYFDASFFGYTPSEAIIMNPQTRLFHEIVWHVIEDAGYCPHTYPGKIGLFAGSASSFAWEGKAELAGKSREFGSFDALQYVNKDFLTTKISYQLNLKGPSIPIHTACSTSLAAVHLAVRSLLLGECEMAIAGGISVNIDDNKGYFYQEGMINSKDGHCRPFDMDSSGTIGGQGGAAVLLKPLKKAIKNRDSIYAVIKGSALNNDGNRKVGYTAPSIEGQVEVIRTALNFSKINSESISYIECHGTGTELGDLIEINALTQAFNTHKKQFCPIGSVKANIGHLDTSSGIAGLIKTALSLKNKKIPPTINFNEPNSKLNLEQSPFFVNNKLIDWENSENPRRAGVSSFGIGGNNVHVILEEPPVLESMVSKQENHVFLLSAKTKSALDNLTGEFKSFLSANPSINTADIAYTLMSRNPNLNYRKYFIGTDIKDAFDTISGVSGICKEYMSKTISAPVFMFPGGGAQHVDMAKQLYASEPIFKNYVDEGIKTINGLTSKDYFNFLYPKYNIENEQSKIEDTEIALPLLLIIEYSLAQLLIHYDIQPQALIGHSLGEYSAACIAKVFSYEDAIKLVFTRGKLMKKVKKGSMLSVFASLRQIEALLDKKTSVAAINSPNNIVLSGECEDINILHEKLKEIEIDSKVIHIDVASHSYLMEPILKEFQECLETIKMNSPKLQIISNVTGDWADNKIATVRYWVEHLRSTVLFSKGVEKIVESFQNGLFIEVGPNNILGQITKEQNINQKLIQTVCLLRRPKEEINDYLHFADKLGELWLYGCSINWEQYYKNEERSKVNLPLYVFDKQKYWIDIDINEYFSKNFKENQLSKKLDFKDWFYYPTWKRSLGYKYQSPVSIQKNFGILMFVNSTEPCLKVIDRLRKDGYNITTVKISDKFLEKSSNDFYVNPGNQKDFERLLERLLEVKFIYNRIIHCWALNIEINTHYDLNKIKESQDCGFYSLINIAQAINKLDISEAIAIDVLTNELHNVYGSEEIDYKFSTILSPVIIIPQEFPNIKCRNIDIVASEITDGRPFDYFYNELNNVSKDKFVSIRNKNRWVPVYENIAEPEVASNIILKKEGVYLIIGGLGRIGFTISEYISRIYKPTLLITGSTELPNKDDWENWLNTHSKEDSICKKINKIKFLESNGASVRYSAIDVCNRNAMEAFINNSDKEFKKINGIIYAAASTDLTDSFKLICDIDKETCEKHFHSKLYGLLTLTDLTKDVDYDFCLLMSSISSLLGGLGFAGYSAGNIFMDYFTNHLKCVSDKNIISVCWDGWTYFEDLLDGGNVEGDYSKMSIQEGQLAFEKVLQYGHVGNIIHSITDINARLAQWVYQNYSESFAIEEKTEEASYNRPNIFTPYREPVTLIEKELTNIWEKFFGYDKVGIDDSFFEIGGNSLKGVTLIAKIHKKLNTIIPIKELFAKDTIAKLAEYIEGSHKKEYKSLALSEKRKYYPLSSPQKRLYFLYQIEKKSLAYILNYTYALESGFDQIEIQESFNKLIQRHESLRTSFHEVNGEVVQTINDIFIFKIENYKVELNELGGHLESFVKPFDLAFAPLVRIGIFETFSGESIMSISIHHIVIDGVSFDTLIKDFKSFMNGKSLQPLKLQYKDFACWQNKINHNYIEKQRLFWHEMFSGELPVLELPTDHPRPVEKNENGDLVGVLLDTQTSLALKMFARTNKKSLNNVFLSLFYVLIHKLSNQEDIIIGTVSAGRIHPDLNNTIGFFVNTLPLRNFPTGQKTFEEFLMEVSERSTAAIDNQHFPLERLIEELKIQRDSSREPLFDLKFSMQNFDIEDVKGSKLGLQLYANTQKTSKYDLGLIVTESNDGITMAFEYYTSIFKKKTIERFLTFLENIIASVIKNPRKTIHDLEMISLEEKQKVLSEANNTERKYSDNQSIITLFEKIVEKQPEKIAIINGDKHFTYLCINNYVNILAQCLIDKGVRLGEPVGILMKDYFHVPLAMLAILKSGGVYLPIDPKNPLERKKYIIKDINLDFLLTDYEIEEADLVCNVLNIQSIIFDDTIIKNPEVSIPLSNPAYVIYTSGTSGLPKGVIVEQEGIYNTLVYRKEEYVFTEKNRMLILLAYFFDAYTSGILTALISGSSVVVSSPEMSIDMEVIKNIVINEHIDYLITTPSYYKSLIDSSGNQSFPCLKTVTLGGDKIKPELIEASVKKLAEVEIVQEYGITEASVLSTLCHHQEKSALSIGGPIANTSIYILNNNLGLQPVGVRGELCISGIGLARGYLNNIDLTAEKFIQHPFKQNAALYRTGDLARWQEDSNLQFLGRIDKQEKIRGFRIELSEIESILLKNDNISDVTVISYETERGEKKLAAFIVGNDKPLSSFKLKSYLKGQLPDYMIPSSIIKIDKIPLSNHGKVDHKTLLKYLGEDKKPSITNRTPKTEVEIKLSEIWKKILNVNSVSLNDTFFDLGGHSLLLMNNDLEIKKTFNVDLPYHLYVNENLEQISKSIEEKMTENTLN